MWKYGCKLIFTMIICWGGAQYAIGQVPKSTLDSRDDLEKVNEAPPMGGQEGYRVMELTEPARFDGNINAFIVRNLKYPDEAISKGMEAKVMMEFFVEGDGTVSNIRCINGCGYKILVKAAQSVIKKTSGKWIPGNYNGTAKTSKFKLPIMFKLQREEVEE